VLIFSKIAELQSFLTEIRVKRMTLGFVPTMGALHQGHISLIKASKDSCDITVCSIFVNPTQFNDKKDLERYPRTPQKDIDLLETAGCDVIFMPEVSEMYPIADKTTFDFGYLDKILDGEHRPGHFNGVAQIVSRLFDIIKPDKAFFGLKDYQQVMIIKTLVKQLKLNIKIVACEILREPDGLAMSSRNTLLSDEERIVAKIIPALMNKVKELKNAGLNVPEIKKHVKEQLANNTIYKLDYFTVSDAATLKEINSFSDAEQSIALIACFVGKIRLIDNIVLS